MHFTALAVSLLASVAVANKSSCRSATTSTDSSAASIASSTSTPGYDGPGDYVPSTVNGSFSFGQHYAVLNLDLINALVSPISTTTPGQAFINNTARWINAVHAQNPPPLSIFSRIYFANARKPEIKPGSGFSKASSGITTGDMPSTFIYPAFNVDSAAGDVVVQKTGYYAGRGNALELILASQSIDTVIISGIRTSGVVLSTVYHLFDLNYNVYVIANNTFETSPNKPGINDAILEGIIPKLPANIITIEQALDALSRSGPAVY